MEPKIGLGSALRGKRVQLEYTHKVRVGHHIKGHPKCRQPHGELFIVTVWIEDPKFNPKQSYIIDFGELKKILTQFFEAYDHATLTTDPAFAESLTVLGYTKHLITLVEPTCENLAVIWFEELKHLLLKGYNLELVSMRVYESEEGKGVTVNPQEEPPEDEPEIKDCPFCGGKAHTQKYTDPDRCIPELTAIMCTSCECSTPKATSLYPVLKLWNSRFNRT